MATARVDDVGADHAQADIFLHAGQQHLASVLRTMSRIQVVVLDDVEQRLGRHDPLADDLHTLVGVRSHGGAHQILRHLLLLDEDRRRGAVVRRQQQRERDRHDQSGRKGRGQQAPAVLRRSQVFTNSGWLVDRCIHQEVTTIARGAAASS